jgi:4-amino-4-deoxy-L-arabinose transferase-like glycosyltransferase
VIAPEKLPDPSDPDGGSSPIDSGTQVATPRVSFGARALERLARVFAFLKSRSIELAIFAVGAALRISMAFSYDATWSYDSDLHWEVVTWIAKHHRVPPVEALFQAQHPPLYYSFAALLYTLGVTRAKMVWVSIACGMVRLACIWLALELYLPGKRWARVVTLALASVVAASVHLDGMVYPEAMSGMWICIALVLVPLGFKKTLKARWRFCILAGLVLGLSMLTKISAVAVIGAIGLAAGLEFLFSGRPIKERLKEAGAWALFLAVCVSVCGWYFARNVRDYGRPFVTTFDLKSQHWLVAAYDGVPLLDRRLIGYFATWDSAVYKWPYYPADQGSHPRFFPVAMASTFVDYWSYSFSGTPPSEPSPMHGLGRPITPRMLAAARIAVVGGTVIFLATVVAWFASVRWAFRRRNFGLLAIVLVPLLTLAAAAHFAVQYPVDSYGVVKGIYMTFGAAPMYALFGIAAQWASSRVQRWPLLGFMLAALWMVATYSFYCRFRLVLLPLSLG